MDALKKSLADYLMGRELETELVNSEGSELIIPIFLVTLPVLGSTGVYLSAVLAQTAELERRVGLAEAAKGNYQAEMDAGRPIDNIFRRTQSILAQIASVEHRSEKAAKKMEYVLLGPDQRFCTICAAHSATKGIPSQPVVRALLRLYSEEIPSLLRVAVGTGLLGHLDAIDDKIAQSAMGLVKEFVEELIYPGFPAMVDRVKNEYLSNQHRLVQDILIAKLAIYYQLVHQIVSS